MNKRQLLEHVLLLLNYVKDDKAKLELLLSFMEAELTPPKDDDEVEADGEPDCKAQLPPKYHDVVRQIAGNATSNLISFFNPDTLELEDLPGDLLYSMELYAPENGENGENGAENGADNGADNGAENGADNGADNGAMLGLSHHKWERCTEIPPLESGEAFRIMENFVARLKNKKEARKLEQALRGSKPFANFNRLIHNLNYREAWFAFRQKESEKYIIQSYFY